MLCHRMAQHPPSYRRRQCRDLIVEYLEQLVLGCLPEARQRRLPLFVKDTDTWKVTRPHTSALLTRKALAANRVESIQRISALEKNASLMACRTPPAPRCFGSDSPLEGGFLTFRLNTTNREHTGSHSVGHQHGIGSRSVDAHVDTGSHSVQVGPRSLSVFNQNVMLGFCSSPEVVDIEGSEFDGDDEGIDSLTRCTEAEDFKEDTVVSDRQTDTYDESYCYPFQEDLNSYTHNVLSTHPEEGTTLALLPHIISTITHMLMELIEDPQIFSRLFSVYLTLGKQAEALMRWHLAILIAAIEEAFGAIIQGALTTPQFINDKVNLMLGLLELLRFLIQCLLSNGFNESEESTLERRATFTIVSACVNMALQVHLLMKIRSDLDVLARETLRLVSEAVFPLGLSRSHMLGRTKLSTIGAQLLRLTVARSLLEREAEEKFLTKRKPDSSDRLCEGVKRCRVDVSAVKCVDEQLSETSDDLDCWIDESTDGLVKRELPATLSELVTSMFRDTQVAYHRS
eukprot:Blabericola_migrator_1__828@NODE_1203_length_5119_cov_116_367577_g815_i0_p1_GENE_NODE_1203_length_5119_cov_116_367577_g815_i0NODE_1203_length_5119_cov_116_367577_g815_i0_p1_ORF_typecomplete_len514_score71_73_NODE_1203_length_5119_cov_116_367577_g815_i012942835